MCGNQSWMMDSHVWSRRKGGSREKGKRILEISSKSLVRDELNFMATCTTCSTTTPNLTLFFYIDSREIGDGEIGSFFAAAPSFQ